MCSIIISKLFFTAVLIPSSDACVHACACVYVSVCVCLSVSVCGEGCGGGCLCVCVCVCVSVVSVIVKHPVLPPCAEDGRSRNPLYYDFFFFITTQSENFRGNHLCRATK